MLSALSDYEYYGGSFLSGASISGDIIPVADVRGLAQPLRQEDAAYLLETFVTVFRNGHKNITWGYPLDYPNVPQGVLGQVNSYLTALYQGLSAALSVRQNPNAYHSNYAYGAEGNYLLNEFSEMTEFSAVSPSSIIGQVWYEYIWDNRLTLSTLPCIDHISGNYYNTWIAQRYPISADYPREMYYYLLNTKVGRGIPSQSQSSRYRYWYGWSCQSTGVWAKSFSTTGVTYYPPYTYTYGNAGYGSSEQLGWTYYDDNGTIKHGPDAFRVQDWGNPTNCWMVKEGHTSNSPVVFTLSRKPKGKVYYLWYLLFGNNNVGVAYGSTVPYTYNGLSSGTITRLEELQPVEDDTTGTKFQATYYGNPQLLEELAVSMGFDMSQVGTKNDTDPDGKWTNFVRRAGLWFEWSPGYNNMLFACFDEKCYLPAYMDWDWTPAQFGTSRMPPSDQPSR